MKNGSVWFAVKSSVNELHADSIGQIDDRRMTLSSGSAYSDRIGTSALVLGEVARVSRRHPSASSHSIAEPDQSFAAVYCAGDVGRDSQTTL